MSIDDPNRPLDHAACEELLPWYVNGTLGEDERAGVDRHVERCDSCRESLDELRAVRTVIREDSPVGAAADDFDRLMATIDGQAAARRRARGWRWLAIAQAAAIVVLAVLAVRPVDEPGFVTLSDPGNGSDARSVNLRVVFAPGVSEADLRELLHSVSASIVDGPSTVGAYGLRVSESVAEARERLAADPRLRLVEIVTPPTGPDR